VGLVRAIETRERRHHAAVVIGSFACLFTGFDDWLFLLAGVLFTIYIKLGNPFARGNRRFVLICAAGCLAAIATKSLLGIGPVEWQPGSIEWQAWIDDKFAAPLATLLRRYTLAFTPMFWITVGYTAWRALRGGIADVGAPDGMTWLAAVAAIFFYVSSQDTASPMLRAQPLLPFYAIGSAILISRLLEGGRIRRALAIAWIAVAPLWAFYIMFSHPRSVLDRDDVAKVRSYLAPTIGTTFVMSNLLSDGAIRRRSIAIAGGAGGRRRGEHASHAATDAGRVRDIGTDYVHAVIFTTRTRASSTVARQLLMRRRLASVTGWPHWSGARPTRSSATTTGGWSSTSKRSARSGSFASTTSTSTASIAVRGGGRGPVDPGGARDRPSAAWDRRGTSWLGWGHRS